MIQQRLSCRSRRSTSTWLKAIDAVGVEGERLQSFGAAAVEEIVGARAGQLGIGLPGPCVADVVTDSNFPRVAAAEEGLHGACAFSIRVPGEVASSIASRAKGGPWAEPMRGSDVSCWFGSTACVGQ